MFEKVASSAVSELFLFHSTVLHYFRTLCIILNIILYVGEVIGFRLFLYYKLRRLRLPAVPDNGACNTQRSSLET